MKLLIPAILIAVLAALSIRVVVAGRSALGDGDDWMLRGKPLEAIGAYETAARRYLPLAPHVDDAYGKLRALAGDQSLAVQLAAWRAIRSAASCTSRIGVSPPMPALTLCAGAMPSFSHNSPAASA